MVKLRVNGKDVSLDGVDPSTPLLWALRDNLGLKGTRFGCGIAQCGSCTVHVNGRPSRSCALAIEALEGTEITTIEGLSENGDHPLQLAWAEYGVPQCGYCQAGQIMVAAALLKDNPAPSDDDIAKGMSGNICRCGTYQRIKAAVKSVAGIGS